MSDYKDSFKSKESRNWIKCWVAIYSARSGLVQLIQDEIEQFCKDILSHLPSSQVCTSCNTPNALPCERSYGCVVRKGRCEFHKGVQSCYRHCPTHDHFRTEIQLQHEYTAPSWKDTRAELWATAPWELAKCYMPLGAYADKNSVDETDLNGLLSIILNCKRFHKHFSADLKRKVTEVREAVNMVRHLESMSCTADSVVTDLLTKLTSMFLDSPTLTAQPEADHALQVFEKLKTEHLTITDEAATHRQFHEAMDALKAWLAISSPETKDSDDTKQTDATEPSIDARLSEVKEQIIKAKKEAIQEVKQGLTEGYEDFKTDLRQRLVTFYKSRYSTLQVSPVVSSSDAPLDSFYIPPEVKLLDPKKLGDPKASLKDNRETITSYYQVFNKIGKELKNIYIQGEPGSGKTSFCRKVTIDWYHCHSNEEKQDSYKNSPSWYPFMDGDVIGEFAFLFLLCLQEMGECCDVFKMIQEGILPELYTGYTPDDSNDIGSSVKTKHLQSLLEAEECLILLDGLDEWTHPTGNNCLRKNKTLPHRNIWKNTAIITTTRPWKMANAEIKNSEIDNLLEICGIADSGALVTRVWDCLQSEDLKPMSADGDDVMERFYRELSIKNLDHFTYIPMMLSQLVCLWHDHGMLGSSRCEIYASMIESFFERTDVRGVLPETSEESLHNFNSLPCMEDKDFCNEYQCVLLTLGKLAYTLLASSDTAMVVVFPAKAVKKILSKAELSHINLALNIGILSEHTTSKVSLKQTTYSFLHKTFQEFLAALYMAVHSLGCDAMKAVFSSLSSVDEVFAMTEVFIFLCGLSPSLAVFMSEIMMERFDQIYEMPCYWFVNFPGHHLQTMVVNGYRECLDNGFHLPKLCLHHLHCDMLNTLSAYNSRGNLDHCLNVWKMNVDNLRSIYIWDLEESCMFLSDKSSFDVENLVKTLSKCGKHLVYTSIIQCNMWVPRCFDLSICMNLKVLDITSDVVGKEENIKPWICGESKPNGSQISVNLHSLQQCSVPGVSPACLEVILENVLVYNPPLEKLYLGFCVCCCILRKYLPPILTRRSQFGLEEFRSTSDTCTYSTVLEPTSLANMTHLSLSRLSLKGGLDLSHCQKLVDLKMNNVYMTDDIVLPKFDHLEALSLSDILVLKEGKEVAHDKSFIIAEDVLAALEHCPILKLLNIAGCTNTDVLCKHLPLLCDLQEIAFRNMDFHDNTLDVPKSLSRLNFLEANIKIRKQSQEKLIEYICGFDDAVTLVFEDCVSLAESIAEILEKMKAQHTIDRPYPFLTIITTVR